MVALDLAVQLVLARNRRIAGLFTYSRYPQESSTGGAARTLATQGTLASGQLGAGFYQPSARTSCCPRIENLDSKVLPIGT